MKKETGLFLTLIFGACFNVNAETVMIEAGKSNAGVFTGRRIGRPEQLAVEELTSHIKAMTGYELERFYRNAGELSNGGFVLSVRPEKEWLGRESAQAFTITEKEKPSPRVYITGNTGMAVLYGVYHYLEQQGVRWYKPGVNGMVIPRKNALSVKDGKTTFTPSFRYRCLDLSGLNNTIFDPDDPVRAEQMHHEWDLWLLRNRLVFDRSIHAAPLKDRFAFNKMEMGLQHNLVPMCKLDKKLLQKEPERFALVTRDHKQERTADNAQICFTNETNIRNAVESAVSYLDRLEKTKDIRESDLDELNSVVCMALADCAGICECPECTKTGGSGPHAKDRLIWSFFNRVAREVRARKPAGKISLFAPYFELTQPPADVKIEPNIVAITCRGLAQLTPPPPGFEKTSPFMPDYLRDLLATRNAGAELMSYDYVLWDHTPQPLSILAAAKGYGDMNYRSYHAEVMQRNELIWPILWSIAHFIWDKTNDPFKNLEQFCTEYYGKENGALVLELLHDIDRNSKKIHRIIYGGPDNVSRMLDDALIAKYRPLLAKAASSETASEQEKERIRDLYLSFDEQMRYAELYRAYCHALNERTEESIGRYLKLHEDFKRVSKEKDLIRLNQRFFYALYFTTDFSTVVPKDAEIKPEHVVKELFAGTDVPEKIDNLTMLPKNWKFQLDIYGKGMQEGWMAPDFDDKKWPEISTWNNFEMQGYELVDGEFWYRLRYKAPEFPAGKRIFLRIGALDDDGDVYVNGERVYHSDDANMWDKSFEVDVTDVFRNGGENVIAVRGYDALGAGGIWKPCALYTK